MKAVVLKAFGSADNFETVDVPVPEVRRGEVRICVRAASFNPVDYQIRKGEPESRQLRSMILGRDLSGLVDAADGATGFGVGDEVYSYVGGLGSSGTYAEYVSVPAELVAKKPRCLTFAQASAVPVVGVTASLALSKARVDATRSVFVAGGAGGVGTFAITLARQLGVRNLVTTAGNAESRAYLVDQCGLHDSQIVDYRATDFVEQARVRNGGDFDIALDFVGGRMLSACIALLAVDGHLASATEAPHRDEFATLFRKNASFHPVGANAYSFTNSRAGWREYQRLLDRMARGYDTGVLPPPPIRILGPLSAEVVRKGHALLEGGAVQGKLVMAW